MPGLIRLLPAPLALGLVAVLAAHCPAATWHIYADGSGDAPTIQGGIGLAGPGDTVLVGPGTYHEQIDFLGKNIVVKGAMGAAATILDGTGLGTYGVSFFSGETRGAVLTGFTVTRSPLGIAILESEPSVIDNIVTANGGTSLYAGIICTGNGGPGPWSPLFQANVVSNNVANHAPGIAAQKKMIPEVLDNVIIGNHANTGDGGGILIRTEFDGTIIRGNWIQDNYAGDHGGGIAVAGISGATVDAEISYNTLVGNRADGVEGSGDSGGGFWIEDTNAWIHHNTIVQSTGNGFNNTHGGAIVARMTGSPLIEQNIIAFTDNGGGIFCKPNVTPIIRNNLAWQNQPVEGAGLCSGWWQGDGNVLADPMFCDLQAGVLTVAGGSPALTHPAGPLGAYPAPGCQPILIQPVTWSGLKSRFRH